MAGTQFTGGKYHGSGEAKAHMRHDDKQLRENTKEHQNKHIDKSKTCYNYSILGLSYKEKCDKYDKRIQGIDDNPENDYRTRRKTRVTMQSMLVYLPKELPKMQQQNWFKDVSNILVNAFGDDNFIDGDIHVDEQHKYYNKKTKRIEMSRIHGHFKYIPEIDGRLNGKIFSCRSNIININNQIEEMTMTKYNCHYMDGTGKQGEDETVEELKGESIEELDSILNNMNELQIQINDLEQQRSDKQAELDVLKAHMDDLQSKADEVLKTANTDAQRVIGEAKEKAQIIVSQASEKAEKIEQDFQKHEDAMDAQRKAIDELLNKASSISDDSLLRYTKTVKFKDGTTIYDRFVVHQEQKKADIRRRTNNLFDIGNQYGTSNDYQL